MIYDVYLNTPINFYEEKFNLFRQRDPVVANFKESFNGRHEGFLGLSVDLIKSIWLLKCLKKFDVDAFICKINSGPQVSESYAMKTAEDCFVERMKNFPGYDFSEIKKVHLRGALGQRAFGFSRTSQKMADEGYVPPAIFFYVDKFDSHILNKDDLFDIEILDNLFE